MNSLLLDNYDAFTWMLRDYIEQCGVSCTVIRNNDRALSAEMAMKFDSIVVSPGPQTTADAGRMVELLRQWVRQKPVLGICLGHQALGQVFGARLIKSALPQHGKVDQIE